MDEQKRKCSYCGSRYPESGECIDHYDAEHMNSRILERLDRLEKLLAEAIESKSPTHSDIKRPTSSYWPCKHCGIVAVRGSPHVCSNCSDKIFFFLQTKIVAPIVHYVVEVKDDIASLRLHVASKQQIKTINSKLDAHRKSHYRSR